MAVLRRHPIVLFVTVLLMWLHLSQIMQHPHIIKLGKIQTNLFAYQYIHMRP